MSPYHLASPTEEELLADLVEAQPLAAVRDAPAAPDQASPPAGGKPARKPVARLKISAPPPHTWFNTALLEMSGVAQPRRSVDWMVSLVFHSLVITTLILMPLYFTDTIDMRQFTQTFLVAPPPPPPLPPPAAPVATISRSAASAKRVFTSAGKLLAPTAIPERVAMLKEEPLAPEISGVAGGVPGGVPGGQIGGVIGGILQDSRRAMGMPAPPPPAKTAPVRIGGRIKAPREISAPPPIYPVLAKQARIQGNVELDAVIDTNGEVVELKVVSGHPLLVPAAIEAVRRWRYQPTILNEEPVAVQLLVTVRFRLSEQ